MTDRRYVRPALAALAYTALTIAYSWPLPLHLGHRVPHDLGDPLLNAWILWWSTKAVPLTAHWWNAPMFYPAVGTLAFSEDLLGLFPISAPLIALSHDALLGYNVALLASFVLSGLGAYFLAYTLTRRHDAAFIAGLAFAFAPYRVAQLPHIQVLSSYWTPVCLAALHRYTGTARTKWALLAAFAWLMQALACGYYLFFLSVLLVFWVAWFGIGRWSVRQGLTLAAAWTVAAMLLAPILLGYEHFLNDTYGFSRDLGAIRTFSADVGGLLDASNEVVLWGWLHVVQKPEGQLFPGVTVIALAIFATAVARPFAGHSPTGVAREGAAAGGIEDSHARVWPRRLTAMAFTALVLAAAVPMVVGPWRLSIGGVRLLSIARADKPLTLAIFAGIAWLATLPAVAAAARRRSALGFYAFAAFAMWVFALGPEPTLLGRPALYQAPYRWLMHLPGFDGLRVPARFWMMCLACLSVIAALAIHRLRQPTRRLIVVLAAIGLVLDGWPRFRVLQEPEFRATPRGVTARLDLPATDDINAVALYGRTLDGVPLDNGFSGYDAPHDYAMRELLDHFDQRVLQAMTEQGPLGVVIDHAADVDGAYRRYVRSYPGARQAEAHPGWSSYRLPASNAGSPIPDEHGVPLSIRSLTAFPSQPHAARAVDGNLETRWSGGVQQSPADFTIELDQPAMVSQLVTDLGEYWTDFPERLRIEVSPDGGRWETVFLGDTMLQAYYGALRHPRQIPLVFSIGRSHVRFLRLTQLGWGTHDWSIAEVRVLH